MIHHIYVFGPPGTEKTRQIVEENAQKFDTTWNEEWLRLVHGLFDEMENPFLTRNVVQALSEEFFEGKAQVDVRCHTQVFKGQVYPAVGVNLKKVEETGDAWFKGEISILQDMVGNLLDNACRFARHEVNVTISAINELSIVIDDDGPGIPPEQRASVLQRGERLDESMPGSGLGLAISVDLVDLYGGELLLEDSPLGGLRVRLLIPKVTQEES
jgi:signal transduction histidine kinase